MPTRALAAAMQHYYEAFARQVRDHRHRADDVWTPGAAVAWEIVGGEEEPPNDDDSSIDESSVADAPERVIEASDHALDSFTSTSSSSSQAHADPGFIEMTRIVGQDEAVRRAVMANPAWCSYYRGQPHARPQLMHHPQLLEVAPPPDDAPPAGVLLASLRDAATRLAGALAPRLPDDPEHRLPLSRRASACAPPHTKDGDDDEEEEDGCERFGASWGEDGGVGVLVACASCAVCLGVFWHTGIHLRWSRVAWLGAVCFLIIDRGYLGACRCIARADE